jgi:hypothetical protein
MGGGQNLIPKFEVPDIAESTFERFRLLASGIASSRSSDTYTLEDAVDIAEGLLNEKHSFVEMAYDDIDFSVATVSFTGDPDELTEGEVLAIRDTALAIWVAHYAAAFPTATSKEGWGIDITVSSKSASSYVVRVETGIILNPVDMEDEPDLPLVSGYYSWNNGTRNCYSVSSPPSIPVFNNFLREYLPPRLPKPIAAYPRWFINFKIWATMYPNPNDVTPFDNDRDYRMFHYSTYPGFTFDTNRDYLCIPEEDMEFYLASLTGTIIPSLEQNIPQNGQRVYVTSMPYESESDLTNDQQGYRMYWHKVDDGFRTLFQYFIGERQDDRQSLSEM